jgi:hypothetical protein
MHFRSTRRWYFEPGLPLYVGLGPVLEPPFCRHCRGVHRRAKLPPLPPFRHFGVGEGGLQSASTPRPPCPGKLWSPERRNSAHPTADGILVVWCRLGPSLYPPTIGSKACRRRIPHHPQVTRLQGLTKESRYEGFGRAESSNRTGCGELRLRPGGISPKTAGSSYIAARKLTSLGRVPHRPDSGE